MTSDFAAGNYRFIPAVFQYSAGAAALPGYEVERVRFDRMPKLADAPSVSVEFIRSGAALGGLGEPGVPPIAPAVANAVFALTGKRVRSLPVSSSSSTSDPRSMPSRSASTRMVWSKTA